MQPAAELLLADGEGCGSGLGSISSLERGPEADQRLERASPACLSSSARSGAALAEHAHHLRDQLAAAAEHARAPCRRTPTAARRGWPRPHSRNAGVSSQPGQHRRCPAADPARAGQQGVEPLEQMGEPEARIPDMGPLVLQPIDGGADLAQQRGAVDLGLRDRSGSSSSTAPATDRSARDVLSDGLGIEAAQPASSASPGPPRSPAAGSKWYLRSRYDRQRSSTEERSGHQCPPAGRPPSEWSPRRHAPAEPSTTTPLPSSEPSSSTRSAWRPGPRWCCAARLPLTLVPCSRETLGPISLRSMVTPSSM